MKGIAAKLVRLMAEVPYAQKDGKNDFHRYKFVSAANILGKVSEACVKVGVASFPAYDVVNISDKVTKTGGNDTLATVSCSLTIIDADSGELVVVNALGSGQDAGDKAVAKAQTMALKYAWMTCLNISTGDDPEADEETDKHNTHVAPPVQQPRPQPPQAPQTPAQQPTKPMINENQSRAIQAASRRKGIDYHTMLGDYGVTSSKELTFAQASNIISRINALPDAPASAAGR